MISAKVFRLVALVNVKIHGWKWFWPQNQALCLLKAVTIEKLWAEATIEMFSRTIRSVRVYREETQFIRLLVDARQARVWRMLTWGLPGPGTGGTIQSERKFFALMMIEEEKTRRLLSIVAKGGVKNLEGQFSQTVSLLDRQGPVLFSLGASQY